MLRIIDVQSMPLPEKSVYFKVDEELKAKDRLRGIPEYFIYMDEMTFISEDMKKRLKQEYLVLMNNIYDLVHDEIEPSQPTSKLDDYCAKTSECEPTTDIKLTLTKEQLLDFSRTINLAYSMNFSECTLDDGRKIEIKISK